MLTRAVEDRMVAMYRGGDLLGSLYTGHWHEAISVGAASTLRPDDYLAPIHRDLGAHLWRGMEPWQVMASFMGKATSPTGGRDGTLHYGRLDLNIYNLPSHIPANFPVATGMAFAAKYRGEDRVCLAFCGDGSTSRADFHEALTIASVLKLPNIFVIENNQYAYSTPAAADLELGDVRRPRRSRTGSRASRWTAPTCWPCTTRSPRRSRGPVRATGRRSSRASRCACTATPSTTRPTTSSRSSTRSTPRRTRSSCSRTCCSSAGVIDDDTAKQVREDARQVAIAARRKALADPMPDPSNIEDGVYAD